jgi:hypothetical protein
MDGRGEGGCIPCASTVCRAHCCTLLHTAAHCCPRSHLHSESLAADRLAPPATDCKLLSPARAMEWIYVDGLYPNASARVMMAMARARG